MTSSRPVTAGISLSVSNSKLAYNSLIFVDNKLTLICLLTQQQLLTVSVRHAQVIFSGGSTLGPGAQTPQIVATPPNLAVLLTHCGQLTFKKISKFDATRCQILRLKCTKFHFRWGSAPEPAGGAYNATPDPLAIFKGPDSKGRAGEERGEGKGRKRERGGKRWGKVRGGEGRKEAGPQIFWPGTTPGYFTSLASSASVRTKVQGEWGV